MSVTTQCCLWVKSNPKNVSSEREPQNTYFRLLNRQLCCFFWKSRFLLDGHRLALQNWTWEFWKISAENHIRWELEKDKRFGALCSCDTRAGKNSPWMGRTRGIHQISINNPQKSAGFESHHRIIAFCHNPSSNQLLLAPKYTMLIKPSIFSDKAQDHKTKDNCARPTTKHVKVYQALVRQTDRQNLFPGCRIQLPDGHACLKI